MKKADVLIEALPYITKFRNSIFVIKYGGSILGEGRIRKQVLKDIVFLSLVGVKIILVHGGGPNISDRMRGSGKDTEFIDGMRVTDKETLRVVEDELNKLNNLIIKEISNFGGKVLGLSGKENKLICVKKKKASVDLGLVGKIVSINKKFLLESNNRADILVICPMGRGPNNKVYNVNADEVASFVASNLLAEKFILLTNVKGVMRNSQDSSSFISTLNTGEAKSLIKDKVIQEGMIPKVSSCIEAIQSGVKKAHIINAGVAHALLLEIFTDEGIGTEIAR
ncbi:MAG: acetylglutamate kinase [Candidatus Omnitrophica bacterium]|nr:acetylglutamate kinase [Candidatus Omnitrophota bacterium]